MIFSFCSKNNAIFFHNLLIIDFFSIPLIGNLCEKFSESLIPYLKVSFNLELLNFYKDVRDNYNLIGSFIYHSCGNIIYYVDKSDKVNPWKESFNEEDAFKNLKVAERYGLVTNYKLIGNDIYTTMDIKLGTLFPVSLLIELGGVRATPLSQFMDFDLPGSGDDFKYVYSKIIEDNTRAILNTLPLMVSINNE